MSIYDDMQAVAASVLSDFQQGVIQYVKVVPGNGSVDNPGSSTKTAFDIPATATGVQFKYVQQNLAIVTDLQIVAPVDPRYTPDMKGFVTVDGVSHKIVEIIRKPAAGTPVVYILIIRRGS